MENNELQISVGENIRSMRNSENLSQQELASLSGIERSQLSRIENGQVDIQLSTISKIATNLNTTPDILLKTTSLKMHPFVKWAGGKGQLLYKLISKLPKHFNNYFEPFIGGGALFFEVAPKKAVINDVNLELLSVYKCFKNKIDYEELLKKLDYFSSIHSEENYLKIRSMDRKDNFNSLCMVEHAARMIYLNKADFNGLYRVNSKGFFNVPSGKKTKVNCYDPNNMRNIFNYFQNSNIQILNGDFVEAVKDAKAGDFVYFDPPYDNFENKNNFTSYSKDCFDKNDQKRLADLARKLDSMGVFVMLSNHNTPFINEIYKGFNIEVVNAKRMIDSKVSGRLGVEEVIITNY